MPPLTRIRTKEQLPDSIIEPNHLSDETLTLIDEGGGGIPETDTYYRKVTHTLTPYEVGIRSIVLPTTPIDSNSIMLTLIGGIMQQQDIDFMVIEEFQGGPLRRITWDATTYGTLTTDLQTTLQADMVLHIVYRA